MIRRKRGNERMREKRKLKKVGTKEDTVNKRKGKQTL